MSIWIKVQDIPLTLEDKLILPQGRKVTDKHINCAQRILKLKFPSIRGLRLTVLQNKLVMQYKFFMSMKTTGYVPQQLALLGKRY